MTHEEGERAVGDLELRILDRTGGRCDVPFQRAVSISSIHCRAAGVDGSVNRRRTS